MFHVFNNIIFAKQTLHFLLYKCYYNWKDLFQISQYNCVLFMNIILLIIIFIYDGFILN